jgi:hypothetical protein
VLAVEQTAGFESQLSKPQRWQKTILCISRTEMMFIFDEELVHLAGDFKPQDFD